MTDLKAATTTTRTLSWKFSATNSIRKTQIDLATKEDLKAEAAMVSHLAEETIQVMEEDAISGQTHLSPTTTPLPAPLPPR